MPGRWRMSCPAFHICRRLLSCVKWWLSKQLGWKVELYPLILQHQELVHPEARPWVEARPFGALALVRVGCRQHPSGHYAPAPILLVVGPTRP